MILKDYLKKNGLKTHQFAEGLGISRQQLSKFINQRRYVDLFTARQIVKATNGEVDLEDLEYCPKQKVTCPCCQRSYWAKVEAEVKVGIEMRVEE